jgi:hypothetical protein
MTWITNQPRSLKSLWPRRVGVEYIEGPPHATPTYSSEELASKGYIGVYVNITKEEHSQLPLARNPEEYKRLSQ